MHFSCKLHTYSFQFRQWSKTYDGSITIIISQAKKKKHPTYRYCCKLNPKLYSHNDYWKWSSSGWVYRIYSTEKVWLLCGISLKMAERERPQLTSVLQLIWTLSLNERIKLPTRQKTNIDNNKNKHTSKKDAIHHVSCADPLPSIVSSRGFTVMRSQNG